jgi:competence ComEA-like helix-hairpin-helix protein
MNSDDLYSPIRRGRLFKLAFLCCVTLLICPLLTAVAKKLPPHPFDLNTATLQQLEELPGVGPVTAQKILDFRAKSGPFKSVSDLLAIPRISKSRFAKIKPYVYVKPPASKSAPSAHHP